MTPAATLLLFVHSGVSLDTRGAPPFRALGDWPLLRRQARPVMKGGRQRVQIWLPVGLGWVASRGVLGR